MHLVRAHRIFACLILALPAACRPGVGGRPEENVQATNSVPPMAAPSSMDASLDGSLQPDSQPTSCSGDLVCLVKQETTRPRRSPVARPPSSPPTVPPIAVAQRKPGKGAAPVRANALVAGEGWGCAGFASEATVSWQCWNAGPSPHAWRVPWLDHKTLQSGPDRVCEFSKPSLTVRCWHRPTRGEVAGREMPATWEWRNPQGAEWNDTSSRSDRIGEAWVGGTFSCLQNTRNKGIWCLGDDAFGQLGGSQPVPPVGAGPGDPAFVQGVQPAEQTVLGTWHACTSASTAPVHGSASGARVMCWGRGDYSQLGAPAPNVCTASGSPVACSRAGLTGPFLDADATVAVGDLFTCVTTGGLGLSCWGANRDGFFGTPGSCPDSLKRAWPTLHGTVRAPRAACSTTPVDVRFDAFLQELHVGPRGICVDATQEGQPRCVGAIPTPFGIGIANVAVSPGADASACGLRDGGVACWGEGYSAPGSLDVPVAVVFEPRRPPTEVAMVGPADPTEWSKTCIVKQGCKLGVAPAPPCAPSITPVSLAALPAAITLSGRVISVSGELGVGSSFSTMAACRAGDGRGCCNHTGGQVVLGGASARLPLDGLFCAGDDSAQCCNAPAYGQTVVATGQLVENTGLHLPTEEWMLTDVTLCTPR